MPNTKSAEKRLRQNKVRRARRRSTKSDVRTQMRKIRESLRDGNIEQAEEQFRVACKKLDKAGSRRLLHPNTASRYKSRLSARIKAAKQSA